MDGCAVHSDRPATHSIDDENACEECAQRAEAQGEAIGSALLVFVSIGYLVALAIGYALLHARPIVGGLAAVVALVVGRALQVLVRRKHVSRRRSVDAPATYQ